MKKILLTLLFFVFLPGISQTVNDYQYIVVPVKYSFLSKENQYRMNTLTKLYLTNLGYTAFYETNIPPGLADNKCDKIFVDVQRVQSLLNMKLKVIFKDCWNKVLFTSETGTSTDKEYERAYPQALESAFKSVAALNYKYNGKKTEPVTQVPDNKPQIIRQSEDKTTVVADQLFAQPTANGFQLVDNTPKIVLKLVRTSQADYYMASGENKQGVVYLKNKEWFFDYYKDEKLISEKLSIKF